ncbi:MAG TPA: hypothetical protein VNF74_03490 [Terriglobales bacterium]|nr:hypothetical protein [Terriglobales bacterium]
MNTDRPAQAGYSAFSATSIKMGEAAAEAAKAASSTGTSAKRWMFMGTPGAWISS